MSPLRWFAAPIVACVLLRPPSPISSLAFPPIAATAASLLPALPFVPFFPVTAADFLPRDTPASHLRRIRRARTRGRDDDGTPASPPPVLVCVGDSLTHGSVSADWVSRLSSRLGGSCAVLNAGRNSETAAAVRARLGDVVAVRPDAVAIMIGTNDNIGALDPGGAGEMYRRRLWWAQTSVPSLEGYREEMEAIVRELDARLAKFGTRIAVLSPPPLGEGGPGGPAWEQGERMAEMCADICDRSSERVTYVPIYDKIRNEMVDALSSPSPRERILREFSYRDAVPLTAVAVPWRIMLRQPFGRIREATGFKYTIDGIHFGDEFASTVEEAVFAWIESW